MFSLQIVTKIVTPIFQDLLVIMAKIWRCLWCFWENSFIDKRTSRMVTKRYVNGVNMTSWKQNKQEVYINATFPLSIRKLVAMYFLTLLMFISYIYCAYVFDVTVIGETCNENSYPMDKFCYSSNLSCHYLFMETENSPLNIFFY